MIVVFALGNIIFLILGIYLYYHGEQVANQQAIEIAAYQADLEEQAIQIDQANATLVNLEEYQEFLLGFALDTYSGFTRTYECWWDIELCPTNEDMTNTLDYWFYEIDGWFKHAPSQFEDDLFQNTNTHNSNL